MSQIIESQVYVLGNNIDTDQILSAEYLKVNPSTSEGYSQLGALAMCGLPEGSLPFLDEKTRMAKYSIIVAGDNFGCGSSREHAVVSLAASGVKAIIAKSFARIFFRNCIVSGLLLPLTIYDKQMATFKTGNIIKINLTNGTVHNVNTQISLEIDPPGELTSIVNAGGIFNYARKSGEFIKKSLADY